MRAATKASQVVACIIWAAPVFAADLPTKKPEPVPILAPAVPSTWRFELTAYGWASSLAGKVGIGQLPSLPYYASFDKVLEHLDGGFRGTATASNGIFIGGADFVWARVSGAYTFEDPASRLFGVQANLKINEATATGFGGVRIPIGAPNLELYGILGVRYFYTGASLTLAHPVIAFQPSASRDRDWIDPLGGFVARYRIDPKWFVNTEADVGGLSDSATGQALAAVGYNWTSNIATTLAIGCSTHTRSRTPAEIEASATSSGCTDPTLVSNTAFEESDWNIGLCRS